MNRQGRLRVYLGAAPGSGKTFAMLREGRERVAHGEDVVVGFVETYARPRTVEAIGRLEVVPRLHVPYRGTVLEEMDLEAVLARRPQVALVDELAHTNAPGVSHPKRWEDVEDLRDAGIDVVTTVNVQHVESVKDLVEHITGIPVRETVPDQVVDRADEIQFIDISPEALRKRMRHGNVYAPEKIDTALRNFFRPGNLAALREIALRFVVQSSGDAQAAVRPPPEDVLVAVSGRASSEALIRHGVRIARRHGGFCSVLTVVRSPRAPADASAPWRALAQQLQASVIERAGSDVARAVIQVTREIGARHVVLGESLTPVRWRRWRSTALDRLIDQLPDTDIHVVARVAGGRRGPVTRGPAERPSPDDLLRSCTTFTARGALRVYLGYAPGVGTTTAMLQEGRRRRDRGTDVVVAAVNTASRSELDSALAALELLGGVHGDARHDLLDVDALLRRNPEVACIDDLAGPDDTGRPRAEMVDRLLGAGITVIATLHLSDLESTRQAMGSVLGDGADRAAVRDEVLSMANELELVDVLPSILDDRLRRGEILPPAEAARALQGMFRPEVLGTLREAAFRLIADHTDRQLVAYMRERHIDTPWVARSRVMVCCPPRPGMESLIHRAARLAERSDAELRVVTVRTRGRTEGERELLGGYASLTHQLGGEFITLYHGAAAPALADYARQTLATELLLTRGRGHGYWTRGTLHQLIRILTDVDVHILAMDPRFRPPPRGG